MASLQLVVCPQRILESSCTAIHHPFASSNLATRSCFPALKIVAPPVRTSALTYKIKYEMSKTVKDVLHYLFICMSIGYLTINEIQFEITVYLEQCCQPVKTNSLLKPCMFKSSRKRPELWSSSRLLILERKFRLDDLILPERDLVITSIIKEKKKKTRSLSTINVLGRRSCDFKFG